MYVQFVDNKKYPSKNPEISDTLDGFQSAGYKLEDDDLVIDIDILDKDKIKAMLKMFKINTQVVWTERGAHLYFKKPHGFSRARGNTALGFPVEYKHKKNTMATTVKLAGVVRETDNFGEREPMPEFFYPKRLYEDMTIYDGEGTGRNNAMYKHKARIMNIPGYKTILKFINEYIFAKPLDDKEFENVSRDEIFTGQKDQEALTADMIMRDYKVVKHEGLLYFKEDGVYKSDPDELNRLIYTYCPGMRSNYVKEVRDQMSMRCTLMPKDKIFEIKFANGILYDGEFTECDFAEFTPYTIDIEYDPEATPVKVVDDYLDHLTDNDPAYRDRVLEILGHCLITDKDFKRMLAKFFIFVGDGGNGKGTLLQVIRKILGSENCSALSITQMKDERYLSQLCGKLVNLGDDIQDEPINNREIKILKNLSTCDTIECKRLYENPYTTEVSASLIFTSNHILKSFEKGESYERRVDWLPMYTKPKAKRPDFIMQLTSPEALKYWIRLIVEGYMRLYENKEFTFSEKVNQFNIEYHEMNNNTTVYVKTLTDESIEGKRSPQIYTDYETWCEVNGETPLSKKQLNVTIEKEMGFKTKVVFKDGKSSRVYQRIRPKEEPKEVEEVEETEDV